MVVLFELALLELVEVIHALPQFALARRVVLVLLALAERDVRNAAFDEDEATVIERVIAFVGGKLFDLKAAVSVSTDRQTYSLLMGFG